MNDGLPIGSYTRLGDDKVTTSTRINHQATVIPCPHEVGESDVLHVRLSTSTANE
jgi:hypothetical protein